MAIKSSISAALVAMFFSLRSIFRPVKLTHVTEDAGHIPIVNLREKQAC